jgi:hypothetical protein
VSKVSKEDHIRQEDLNSHDEPAWEEISDAAPPTRGGGNRGSFRTYTLVAALILMAIFGFSRSTWAIPSLGLPTRGCCRPAAVNPGSLSSESNPQAKLAGCCGGGSAEGIGGDYEEELRQAGLQFYLSTSGDSDVEGLDAIVQDFGCHQEIYVFKGGQQVMRVGYAGGQVYEIPETP